ncbi:MAG: TlpA disulfide reductase family protein [Hyphomicrobiaceae bacterium]
MTSKRNDNRAGTAAIPGLPLKAYAAVGAFFAVIGFGAVYVAAGGTDNRKGDEPASSVTAAPRPASVETATDTPQPAVLAQATAPSAAPLPAGPGHNPLSVGQMAAFVFKPKPEPLPKITFVDATGKERTLEDWKGKVVLLNLWATWCLPCRKEMPGLDRLQGELGSDKFEVVAVSVDRTGTTGAKKFLDQIKVEKLAVLADPTARMATTLRAIGMPASLLLDTEGREIGRMVGPAEWDTAEAKALIKAALR